MSNNPSISFLIGAGFSAPMGYPIGNQLNDLLVNCSGNEFSFHTDGTIVISSDGKKPHFGYKNSYELQFDLLRKLISHYYTQKSSFDYEEFYDFLHQEAVTDKGVAEIVEPYLKGYSSVKDVLHYLNNIYNQMVAYYLKDGDGNKWYDNAGHVCRPIFPGYTGILNVLHELLKTHIVNMHSLNHDLFFERLNWSDWINGEICDGFEELGSPYYGELYTGGRCYKVRLERYTGRYDKKIRFYKLHGSADYVIYYADQQGVGRPEVYLKTRFGVRTGDLYKEKNGQTGDPEYEHCSINYHADFLTGTTSKMDRYGEPLIYKKNFEFFRNNLIETEMLIIIGYGGKDEAINKMIRENFDFVNKKVIIIDPFPGEKVKILQNLLHAKLVKKHLEVIDMSDIIIAVE